MADNILRQDIIQLDFEIAGLKELNKLQDEINELKKKLTGGIGDDALDGLKDGAKESVKPLKKVEEQAEKVTKSVTEIGKRAAVTAFNGLKKIAGISFKTLTVGIGAAATALGALVGKSVQAFGEFEQLKGGMEKIFDKADISGIMKDANNAYKDLGVSANDYLRIINDTGATFAAVMGDQKGYETAKTGLTAISDYASGTGKNIDELSEKFTLITRSTSSYQSIADQFSGILPATSKDFLKQAQAAGLLDNKYTELTKVPVAEYQQAVSKMLEKGVADLGLTGNTAEEATKTLTGSLGMMRASWSNLLTAMASGENLDQCVDNMVSSVEAFGKNVMPVAEKALVGLGTVIEKLAPIIAEKLPSLVDKLLPPLIKAAVELTMGLIKALPNIIKTLATSIVDVFGQQFPIIQKIGDFFKNNAGSIAESIKKIIPVVIALAVAFKGFKAVKSITSLFGGGKGESSGGKGESGGLLSKITSGLQSLAKVKPTTILKGMANLAIILGSFTIVATAFMLVAPILAEIGDLKAFLKMMAVIAILGVVSGELVKFAGIAGKMPVTTVLLGLANMGIVIAGMSALVLLVGATSLLNFDYLRILALVGLIGVLGAVGGALAILAGIVGAIPIPVVLMGLANIALVLGGITALIIAFGALSEIKGFNEFIAKGGETLAILFNVIGKIAGSLIGGVIEGIAESLPKIAESIAGFAEALKPMFGMFKGVDMGGVGTFFSALGGFVLQMSGSKILDFFTGGPDFSGVAKGLGALTGEGVKKFFAMVNSIEETAFPKAKQFFECLDGISALPNTGGIGQLFSGENDFAGVATGLGKLSGEGVKKFFTMVGGLNETAFSNATEFFKALNGISELPNSGGMAQWFSGKNDFSGVADGLKTLSSQGVKDFFTMVNGINLNNLNGLWKSLKDAGKITTKNLSEVFDEGTKDLVSKISKLPKRMGDALKNNSKDLSNGIVEMWKAAVEASISPVNKLLDGANHILKEFGSKKKVISWTPYAKGTDGHKGGNALVNDGNGAELIQLPNGNMFIPQGRNVFIPNAPKGMRVLPAGRTAQLMGRNTPTFKYASGIGDVDLWNYYDNAEGLISKISQSISYNGMSKLPLNVGRSMVSMFTGEMSAWVEKLFEEEIRTLGNYNPSKGVLQWRSTVARALKMEGQYSIANVARTLYQMSTESGGNPKAINLWDSNAKKGTPSKGLMQVIDPTFKAYARKGFDKNIYDPLSNILASIRYAVSRYGSLAKAYRGVGYANGGIATKPSIFGEDGAEMAIPLSADKRSRGIELWRQTGKILGLSSYTPERDGSIHASNSVEYNTYSPHFELNISGTNDDRAMARKVKRWIAEAMDDMFDTYESKTPRTQEV